MSVALFKYKSNISDPNAKLLVSMNIASERMYRKYLLPVIAQLHLSKFADGTDITFEDRKLFAAELDILTERLKTDISDTALLDYFIPRLEDIKNVLPHLLEKEGDIIHIF